MCQQHTVQVLTSGNFDFFTRTTTAREKTGIISYLKHHPVTTNSSEKSGHSATESPMIIIIFHISLQILFRHVTRAAAQFSILLFTQPFTSLKFTTKMVTTPARTTFLALSPQNISFTQHSSTPPGLPRTVEDEDKE